jgi:hypothetical protein
MITFGFAKTYRSTTFGFAKIVVKIPSCKLSTARILGHKLSFSLFPKHIHCCYIYFQKEL